MRLNPSTVFVLLALVCLCPATFGEEAAKTETPTVEVLNGNTPVPGVLTAGQPTEEQLVAMAEAGYRTVVNMRTDGEQGNWDARAKAEALGMEYIAFPIRGAKDLTRENAERLAELLDDAGKQPMVVHCGSSNRVGALFAMKSFFVDGKDADTALGDGRAAGLTRMEAAVAPLLVRDDE